ncbi:MAG: PDGLE domain-containing protein [Candidatus Omnitrophota bacterium]
MKITAKLWLGIILLAILAPLGLSLPEYFRSGEAWGEWSADKVKELAGYIPKGMEALSDIWKAPVPDYASDSKPGYIISAILGVLIIALLMLFIGRKLSKKE